MCRLICLAVATLAVAAMAYAAPVLVHGCNDLSGVSVAQSSSVPATKLEMAQDRKYVSEGSGCWHLSSVSPRDAQGNTYLSLVVTTASMDMRGKSLQFEAATSTPDETKALYVRGYNAGGQPVLSWMSWAGPLQAAVQTFELTPGVSDNLMGWEPGYLKSDDRSAVVRWEFYVGTAKPGAAYDLYLDNLRVTDSTRQSFADTTQAHRLYPQTTLVRGGRAVAIIVAPADKQWLAVAGALAAAIKHAAGADLPVKPADQVTNDDLRQTTCVLLGNVANNRAMLYPYSHMMMFADGVFPGAGGYELRSVSDPWGTGKGMLILGATDVSGAQAAVGAFAKLLKPAADLTLDRVCDIKPGADAEQRWGGLFTQTLDAAWLDGQKKTAEDALVNGAHTGLFGQMADVGEKYALTGRPEYAQLFVWLARRANQHYLTKPDTFGGPWGMDSDFMSQRVIPAWDAVEECPALTDADRLDVARILFQYVTDACLPEGTGAASAAAAGDMVSNHGTFAALGTFCAGEYFGRYYNATEARSWLEIGDRCFKNLAASTKAHEDCNGYQWLTNLHNIRYAQMKGDLTIFENGTVRRMADYAILTMNNLGYEVPYGDTGEWKCWFSEVPVLRAAEWFYGDGRYQWAVDHKTKLTGRVAYGEYECAATAKEPADLIGSRAWALEPRYYKADKGLEQLAQIRAFDKLAFRTSFDPNDGYLLLDGLSNGGHKHLDGNSILQWTENGRIWLCDADYYKSLPKYHNTVLIIKDGQSAPIPGFVELEHAADLPSFAGSTTTYRNYGGVDWRRNVLWVKDRMFVVVDQMVAKEAGDYSFHAIWQTVGDVAIRDSGLDIAQKGQYARFATTSDMRCLVDDDPVTGKNWASYPFADKPLVRVFQTVLNRRLKAGEVVNLFTVLQASGDKPAPLKVVRLNASAAAIVGAGEPVVVAVKDGSGRLALPGGPVGNAAAAVLTPEKGFALGMTDAEYLGQKLAYPEGADVEFAMATGDVVLKTPAGTTAEGLQRLLRLDLGEALSQTEVRGFMDMAIKTAPPCAAPASAPNQLPALVKRWSYIDKLGSYLLTNNADAFEAVDTGAKLSCNPQPLARNVFATDDSNKLDNLTDGVLLTTAGGVMWDTDQTVTLDLKLDNAYDLDRVALKAWFASSSSRNKLFQLGRVQVTGSNDGFQKDMRTLADRSDSAAHGNWGAPGYGPQLYDFPLKGKARALRLTLTPRPGTAIYLAELQLWGNRPGLEIDLATKLSRGAPVHTFTSVKAADLNGDKVDEIIAGSTNGNLYCFGKDGKILWKLDCGAPVNVVNTVDFAGDGHPAVLAGCMDAKLVAADGSGEQLWVFNPPYYKRAGHIRVVFPAKLDGSSRETAIVGAENWHYYAVGPEGKALWQYESVHASTAGCAADLNGDRKDEIVAGTEYYWWHGIKPDGSRLWSYTAGPCVNAAAAGDLNGDGRQEAVFGAADSLVHVLDGEGKLLWSFNTGDEVTSVQCADVNGDHKDEVLVGSLSFNVYCLDGAGKVLWRKDVGSAVRTLAVMRGAAGPLVAAGTDDGNVHVFSAADGKASYQFKAGAAVKSLAFAAFGGMPTLIAITADGNLTTLALPAPR